MDEPCKWRFERAEKKFEAAVAHLQKSNDDQDAFCDFYQAYELAMQEPEHKELLDKMGDALKQYAKQFSLVKAVKDSDLASVKALLHEGVNPNIRVYVKDMPRIGDERASLIFEAVKTGNVQIVKELINAGANVNAEVTMDTLLDGFLSTTSLTIAVGNRDWPMIRLLVERGASSDNIVTLSNADSDVLKFLLKSGADPDILLNDASAYGLDEKTLRLLMEHGGNRNLLMSQAIKRNLVNMVQGIIEEGFDPNEQLYVEEMNPIDLANEYERGEIVKLLEEYGAVREEIID